MIVGVGTDIIEIERIKKAISKERFLNEVFTVYEREYYKRKGERPETLAGFFAVKEAVAKSIGTGFRGFYLGDIEVFHDEIGAPKVKLGKKAQEVASGKGITQFHVSISHNESSAIAFVIASN